MVGFLMLILIETVFIAVILLEISERRRDRETKAKLDGLEEIVKRIEGKIKTN